MHIARLRLALVIGVVLSSACTTPSGTSLSNANWAIHATRLELPADCLTTSAITISVWASADANLTFDANTHIDANGTLISHQRYDANTTVASLLSDISVRFTASDANVILSQPSGLDPNGVAHGSIASCVSGNVTVRGWIDGITTPAVLQEGITLRFADAKTSALPVDPNAINKPSDIALTLTADTNQRVVGQAGFVLTISGTHGGDPMSGASLHIVGFNEADHVSLPGPWTLDGDGKWQGTLISTVAGIRRLQVSVANATQNENVCFLPGPFSLLTSTLTANSNIGLADGNTPLVVTTVARDAFQNPLTNRSVLLRCDRTDLVYQPIAGVTDDAGVFTSSMTATELGDAALEADVEGQTLAALVTFVPGAIDANTSTLENLLPTGATADGVSLVPMLLTAKDRLGHPVPGSAVDVTSPGSHIIGVVPDEAVTGETGTLSFAVSSNEVGAIPVRAATGNIVLDHLALFVPGAPSGLRSLLTVTPNMLVADGATTGHVLVEAVDAGGHPVPGLPVSFGTTLTNATIVPPSGITDANGQLFAAVTATRTGVGMMLANLPGLSLQAPVSMLPGVPVVSASTLSISPSSLMADGIARATVRLRIKDVFSNPVVDAPVSLSVTPTGISLLQPSGQTDSAGIFETALTGTTEIVATVSSAVSDGMLEANATLVPGGPSGRTSTFVASPNAGIVADLLDATTLRVRVEDELGHVVPNQYVSLKSREEDDIIEMPSGHTDANGVFESPMVARRAGVRQVSAQIDGSELSTTVAFIPGALSAATSELTLSASKVTADTNSQLLATVRARDALGNDIGNVRIAWSVEGPDARATDVVMPPANKTDADGSAHARLTAAVIGDKRVRTTLSDDRNTVIDLTAAWNATAGAIDGNVSRFVVSPNVVIAGADGALATLTLLDTFGNPIADQDVSVQSVDASLSLSQASGTTSSDGTFVTVVAGTAAGLRPVLALYPGGSLLASVRVLPAPLDMAHSRLMVSPNQQIADGLQPIVATLTMRDAFQNAIAGQNVTVSSSASLATTMTPSAGVTDSQGQFVTSARSSVAQSQTLVATGGNQVWTRAVSFLADVPSATLTLLSATPNLLLADGLQQSQLTLTARDKSGNLIAAQPVALQSSIVADAFAQPTGTTGSDGRYTTAVSSTTVGVHAVTAYVGATNVTTQLHFTVGALSAAASRLTLTPNVNVVADGVSPVLVRVEGVDAYGHPAVGQSGTLSSSAPWSVLGSSSITLDNNGVWQTTLVGNNPGVTQVVASFGTTSLTGSASFVVGAIDANASSLLVSPTQLLATGAQSGVATAIFADASGHPIANQLVYLTSDGAATFVPSSGTTDDSGRFTAGIASSVVGLQRIHASASSATLDADANFLLAAANVPSTTLSTSANAIVADGMADVTVQFVVTDSNGQPLVQQNVTLSATGNANAWLTQTIGTTDSNGVFTTTLKAMNVGLATIHAQVGPIVRSVQVLSVAGEPNASLSSLRVLPSSITADGAAAATVIASVVDSHGFEVGGLSGTFSASGSNTLIASPNGQTSISGVATTSVSSTQAQSEVVQFSAGNLILQAPLTCVPGVADANVTSVSVAPPFASVDGVFPVAVTTTLRDHFGNLLPNAAFSVSSAQSDVAFAPGALSASGTSDANGRFVVSLGARAIGQKSLVVTAAGVPMTTQVTFVAGQPNAAVSTLQVRPTTLVANGGNTSVMTLQVRDQFGNPIAGDNVTFAIDGNQAVLTPASAVTDANGTATTSITSTSIGAATLRATEAFGHVTLSAPLSLQAGNANVLASQLMVTPSSAVADGNAILSFRLRARDAFANPVASTPVSIAMQGAGLLVPAAGTTDANGCFEFQLSSTVAETKTVAAVFSTGGSLPTSVTFVAGMPSLATSTFTGTPSLVVADGTSTLQVFVNLRDALGNAASGHNVTFSSSLANDVFSPPLATSDAAGLAPSTVTSQRAGTHAITAAFDGGNLTVPFVFVSGPVSGLRSRMSACPNVIVADGLSPIELTVHARDAFDNPIANQTVSLGFTGGNATMSSTTGTSNANGIFRVAFRSTQAGSKQVTATLDGTSIATYAQFVAGAPASVTSSLSATPNEVTADGASSATSIATFLDAFGNPCGNHLVSFTSTNLFVTFDPNNATTNAAGQVVTAVTSPLMGSATLKAQASNAVVSTSLQFVPGAPDTSQSVLTITPNTLVADGTSSAVLSTLVLDAQGNPIAGVPIALNALNHIVLQPSLGVTGSDGRFDASAVSTTKSRTTVSAQIEGLSSVTGILEFLPGPIDRTRSTLVASPAVVAADGNAQTTLYVTAADVFGNAVGNQNVTLTVSGRDNVVSLSAGQGDDAGLFVSSLTSTRAESKTVTATLGVNGARTSLNTNVVFLPGSASSSVSTLTASPNLVVADGVQRSLAVVTVVDAAGNPVANQNVHFSTLAGHTHIAPCDGVTDANGQVQANITSTSAMLKTVTATLPSYSLSIPVTFVAGPPSPQTSTLTILPGEVFADGVSNVALSLALVDAYGNCAGNQNVTFAASGSNNTWTLAAPGGYTGVSVDAVQTCELGKATAAFASTKAELKNVTASFSQGVLQGNVLFVAGPVSNAKSSFSVTPASVLADGNAKATLQVQLADGQGNPLYNATVVWSSSALSDVFVPATSVTDATGTAQASVASHVPGTRVLAARSAATSLLSSVDFAHGAVSAATSTVTASPNVVTADGISGTTLTLQLRDAIGNPVEGAPIVWSASSLPNVFGQPVAVTDASGVASTSLSSTFAASKTVTAGIVGGTALSTTVQFVPGPAYVTTSVLVATPSLVVADGATPTTLWVQLNDALGNPISNAPITWSASGTKNVFSSASGITDGPLGLTTKLTSTKTQTETITATTTGLTLSTPVVFVSLSPNAVKTTLTASPNVLVADGNTPSLLTARVVDSFDNPVGNQLVQFAITGLSGSLQSPNAMTDANGLATVSLTSTRAGLGVASASVGNTTVLTGVTFLAGNANASDFQLIINPNVATADGSSLLAVSVTIVDSYGNPIGNQTLSIGVGAHVTLAGGNTTLLSLNANLHLNANGLSLNANATTDLLGSVATTVSSTVAQASNIVVSLGNVTVAGNITFVAGPTSNLTSTFTYSPSVAMADGNSPIALTLTARDLLGNAAGNRTVTLSSTGQNNSLSPNGAMQTDANGVAVFSLKSTRAEQKTVIASIDGTSFTTWPSFVAGLVSPNTSTFTMSPNAVTAGTSALLVAYAFDAFGNPIANQNMAFMATSRGTLLTLGTSRTDSTGRASVTTSPNAAGGYAAVATAQNQTLNFDALVTAASPNATQSTLTLTGAPAVADSVQAISFVATMRDAFGNAAGNQVVTFASSNTNDSLAPPSATTDANGVVTGEWKATRAQAKTMSAQTPSATVTAAATFVAGPPSATASKVIASPNATSVADGVASSALLAIFQDAFSNPLAGQTVTFSATGGNNVLLVASQATDANGRVLSSLKSTVAETKTLNATLGNVTVSTPVMFVPGPADAGHATLAPTANSVIAGGNLDIVVRFADAFGNPKVGAAPTLAVTGSAIVQNNLNAPLDATGAGVFSLFSTKAEAKTLTATLDAATVSANVTILPASPNATASTLSVAPSTAIVADDAQVTTVSLIARDRYANLISGVAVTLSSSGATNRFSAATGVTAADATYVSSMCSRTAETKLVSAQIGAVQKSATVTFIAGSPNQSQSSFVASPLSGVPANNNAVVTATLTLADKFGNRAGGVPVQWRNLTPRASLSSSFVATGPDGIAAVTAKSTMFGPHELTATAGGVVMATSANFTKQVATCGQTMLFQAPPTVFATGAVNASLVVAADLNRDGNTDVVSLVNGNSTVAWSMGRGNGLFNASGVLSAPACQGANGLVVADVTRDGFADAVFVGTTTNNVCVVKGASNGNLTAVQSYATHTSPVAVTLADVNGDGNRDIITVNTGLTGVSVLLSKADGTFQLAKGFTFLGVGVNVTSADVNLDGYSDVIVTSSGTSAIYVFRANSLGDLTLQQAIATLTSQAGIVAGDFTGDGYVDLASVSAMDNTVSVFANQRNGAFLLTQATVLPSANGQLEAFDFTKDGVIDIVAGGAGSVLYPLVNPGSGTMVVGGLRWGGANANIRTTFTHADVNKDGNQDILLGAGQTKWLFGDGSSALLPHRIFPAPQLSDARLLDIDADGKLDLLGVQNSVGAYVAAKGNGDGSFQSLASVRSFDLQWVNLLNLLNPNFQQHIRTLDVDGDGYLDLLVMFNPDWMGVAYNDGNGLFSTTTKVSFGTSNTTGSVVSADVNGDGIFDLVGSNGNTLNVALGQGSRSFAAPTPIASSGFVNMIDTGDLNADGMPDFVALSGGNQVIDLYVTGAGGGGLTRAGSLPVTTTPARIALRDLNGDGLLDLVYWGRLASKIGVRLGTGPLTFGAEVTIAASAVQALEVEDVNGDGVVDLVFSGAADTALSVSLGASDGSFAAPLLYPGQTNAQAMMVADINGDGLMDIASTSLNDGYFVSLLQSGCAQ